MVRDLFMCFELKFFSLSVARLMNEFKGHLEVQYSSSSVRLQKECRDLVKSVEQSFRRYSSLRKCREMMLKIFQP